MRGSKAARFSVMVLAIGAAWCAALAWADAPPGRYVTTISTVEDTRTGLMWQRGVEWGTYLQDSAMVYCNLLDLGGQSDWRLPTRAELLSIADRSRKGPALDTMAFPATPSDYMFWTSSPYVGSGGHFWYVLDDGSSSHNGATTPGHVRCVR